MYRIEQELCERYGGYVYIVYFNDYEDCRFNSIEVAIEYVSNRK